MSPDTKEPLHIAFFLPSLGGRGAQRVLVNLANEIAGREARVDLVVANYQGDLISAVSPQVHVADLNSHRGVLRSLPALQRYLREHKPTVLVTAMDYVNVLVLACRKLRRFKTKIVATCHNNIAASISNSPWVRDRLLPMGIRLTYGGADAIVAVSQGVADTLADTAGIDRSRIKVIYNPAAPENVDELCKEEPDHKWLKAPGEPVILGVGSLTRQKDFRTLIEAFALSNQTLPSRLILLGEGEEREALANLAAELGVADRVDMPGWVKNPYAYMSRSSLFVLSSRWEGFGLVLAEALACGVPVVSTDCPSGPAEILEGGKHGKLVTPGDAGELSQAISATLDNPPETENLKHRGRSFSLAAAADNYLDLIGSLKN
ncbi:MAG: glycosyltransferase [Planctomycetales bacterium]|nr:glycosyltransferase [Planctomycetales bacterium]